MSKARPDKESRSDQTTDLRQRAEEKIAQVIGEIGELSLEEMRLVSHELQVHQIELEMQNEELRRTQAELEASKARYFALYDLAPLGYFTISEKGLILEANLTAAHLFGETKSTLINQPFSHFILPEDQDIYYHCRKQLFKTGEHQACELRLAGKAENPLWVRIEATSAMAIDGSLECRAMVSDISARTETDRIIEHLASFPRLNPSPVIEFDFNGALLYFNDAATKAVEKSGDSITAFIPDNLPALVETMKQGGGTQSFHCEVAIDDQTYGETVYLSKELNVVRIYAQNITHLKHAEAILKLSQGELELLVRERTAELHRVNEHLVQEVAQHKQADSEIQRLKEKIREENIYLRKEVSLLHSHKEIIGNSEAIRHVLKRVEQVASVGSTVLIQGETGTGKELIAHSIHNLSSRKGRLMIKVNCAALPPTLIESELFGREKGAYTGALSKQIGRFELADDSTIFLDEVDSLPLELQAKLLRVLESGEFERLGSPRTVKVNVRIIAATNSNLADVVVDGRFREDLYYRLNVFLIQVPPLRERREDIAPLLWFFVKEFCEKMGKRIESIPLRYVQAMQAYTWPGNIREMRNVIERAMIIATGSSLPLEVPKASQTQKNLRTLQDVEKKYIIEVLDTSGWRVSGKGGAAEILGINPKTLESRIKKMGIQRNKNNT